MKPEIVITELLQDHWTEASNIYKDGIDSGIATFETEIPSWESWDKNHIKSCRLVAINENRIVGWAALSPVSSRCVYGGVAEVSVYVDIELWGKKIGEKLMLKIIEESELHGYWTLQSGVFPENKASIELHRKVGFREIGYREKVGQLDGVWKDNILWERRSKIVGK